MKAYCLIQQKVRYRHDAFMAGLAAAGYQAVHERPSGHVTPGDLLVIWNRYGEIEQIADRFEAAGGTVVVAENGYLGRAGTSPKFDLEGTAGDLKAYVALSRHGHNGAGNWNAGGPERFAALGVELAPWRGEGKHILVCPNRHFGMRGFIMPLGWEQEVAKQLQRATGRPVRIRRHPGNDRPKRPIEEDLQDAWAVAVWASTAGLHALVRGIPVIAYAPFWIAKPAAATLEQVQTSRLPERRPVFERLAWAQWTVEEIATGEPFRHLLRAEAAAA